MPVSMSGMTPEQVKSIIHGLEEARSEGKSGTETGSKIRDTPNATYGGKKK